MSQKRRQRRPRQVQHFIVQPEAYNQVIQLLGTLPYSKVAGTLQALTENSQAVFETLPTDEKPPPGDGKIVDNPEAPAEDQPPPGETVETEDTKDNVVELEVDPPANDPEQPETGTNQPDVET